MHGGLRGSGTPSFHSGGAEPPHFCNTDTYYCASPHSHAILSDDCLPTSAHAHCEGFYKTQSSPYY